MSSNGFTDTSNLADSNYYFKLLQSFNSSATVSSDDSFREESFDHTDSDTGHRRAKSEKKHKIPAAKGKEHDGNAVLSPDINSRKEICTLMSHSVSQPKKKKRKHIEENLEKAISDRAHELSDVDSISMAKKKKKRIISENVAVPFTLEKENGLEKEGGNSDHNLSSRDSEGSFRKKKKKHRNREDTIPTSNLGEETNNSSQKLLVNNFDDRHKKKKELKHPEIGDNEVSGSKEVTPDSIQELSVDNLEDSQKKKKDKHYKSALYSLMIKEESSNLHELLSDDSKEWHKKKKKKQKEQEFTPPTSDSLNKSRFDGELLVQDSENDRKKKKKKHKESELSPATSPVLQIRKFKKERSSSQERQSLISVQSEASSYDLFSDAGTPRKKKKRKHCILDVNTTISDFKVECITKAPSPLNNDADQITETLNSSNKNGEESNSGNTCNEKENDLKKIQEEKDNTINSESDGSTNNLLIERYTKHSEASSATLEKSANPKLAINRKYCDKDISTLREELEPDSLGIDVSELLEKSLDEERAKTDSYSVKLLHLFIVVDWEIPEAHMFEKSITTCPKKLVQQAIEKSGVEIKKGPYTQKEDKIIRENWKEFSETYNFPDPSVFFSFKNANTLTLPLNERIKFAQFLGKGLNTRLLFSIYQRFKVLFGTINKGKFTDYENKVILKYLESPFAKDSDKFAKLAKVLNRDRVALLKHSEMLLKEQGETVKWNLTNMEKLLKSLMNNTLTTEVQKLRSVKISSDVWKEVSKDLHVSEKKAKYVWESKLYPMLFLEERFDQNTVMKTVVDYLFDNKIKDWKLVKWEHLASLYPGLTSGWLYKHFRDFVRTQTPKEMHKSLKESIIYLRKILSGEVYQPKRAYNKYRHKTLIRLKFENGVLHNVGSNITRYLERDDSDDD